MNKDEYYHLIVSAFSWLNQLSEKKEDLKKDVLEKFFTEDVEICTNNQPLVGLDKFYQHLEESVSHYAHSKVVFPFKAYISDQKKAALYYVIKSVTIENEASEYLVMSIFKFRNVKISAWHELVLEIS